VQSPATLRIAWPGEAEPEEPPVRDWGFFFVVFSPQRLGRVSLSAGVSRTVAIGAAIAVGATLVYTVLGAIVRPAMYSDAGWGFLGWYDSRDLPFNTVLSVDRTDIARDVASFATWWTPGQHLLPGLLERAGLELGQALIAVTALFSLLGLAGWYALYRSFGFPAATCALAVAAVALSRHFALPFGIYTGGEVLLFGTAPWFLTVLWRLRGFAWSAVPLLLVGATAMVFAKLSGLLIAASAIAAAVMAPPGLWYSRDRIRRGLVAGLTLGLIGTLFYVAWFSRGTTPVAAQVPIAWSSLPGLVAYVTAAAWGGALSIGDLAMYLLAHPARPRLDALAVYALLLPLAIATFAFVGWQLRRDYPEYLRFVLFLGLGVGLVIVAASTRGATLGTEERHLRIVSLVLFVGIVQAFLGAASAWPRRLLAATVAGASLYGVASAAQHAAVNAAHPLGNRGFRHLIADQAVLDALHAIDTTAPDRASTLVLVPSPEIGLELRRVRVTGIHVDFETPAQLERRRYRGQVPRLHVVLQRHLVDNGKAPRVLRIFVDTPAEAWQATPHGSFVVYSAVR